MISTNQLLHIAWAVHNGIPFDVARNFNWSQFKMSTTRFYGVVKFFSDEKGYGFITPDIPNPDGSDVFVHKSNLPEGITNLPENQKVSYTVVDSAKRKGDGKKAADIQIES